LLSGVKMNTVEMRPRSVKDVDVIDKWYTLSTKSRHEFVVRDGLEAKGFETYLPARTVIKKWSDRKKKVTEPLFKGYVFVYMPYRQRINALETPGVVKLVMFNGRPGTLHQYEIDLIKKLLEVNDNHGIWVEALDGVREGDLVEVVKGPLMGLRGNFARLKNANRLIISIDSIGKSLAVEIPVDYVQKVK
jgi:transcription antitermination factor NusG